jgi:hypothetical protein
MSIRPTFAQDLDTDRPHTLITENTKRACVLLYRYDDTQELVAVPNSDYKQTYQERVDAMCGDAKLVDCRADILEKLNPDELSPEVVNNIVSRLRIRADNLRAEASKIE